MKDLEYMDHWHVLMSCPLCGENAQAATPINMHGTPFGSMSLHGITFPVSFAVSYRRCVTCGVIYQNPRMTPAALEKFYDSVRQRGARFVLVSIPMNARERDCLSDLAARHEIPYLPLDSTFRPSGRDVTFPHDGHWNEAGHETAAAAIERFMHELGIF